MRRGKKKFYFKVKAENSWMQIMVRAFDVEEAKRKFFLETQNGNFIVSLHISEKPFFVYKVENTNFQPDRKIVTHL